MSEDARDEAVERLLEPLRRNPPVFTADRQAAVWAQIDAQLQRPAPTRWRLAAAAVVLVGVGIAAWQLQPPPTSQPASVAMPSETRPAPQTERVVDDSVILPSGAEVTVAGEVRVAEASATLTRIILTRGRVTSTVPPLNGARFVVTTPTADVTVHGTRFEVALRDDAATLVRVTEGRVAVQPRDDRQAVRLGAGESTVVEPTSEAGAARAAERSDHAQAIDIRRALAERGADELTLRNALLRLGRAADERATDYAPALWGRAVQRFPAGMHADEFAWRAAQALARAGRADAAHAAWARFRERFPDSPRAAAAPTWLPPR